MTERPGPLETNAATRSSRVARSRRRNTSQADTPSPSQAFPSPARRGKCRRRWGPRDLSPSPCQVEIKRRSRRGCPPKVWTNVRESGRRLTSSATRRGYSSRSAKSDRWKTANHFEHSCPLRKQFAFPRSAGEVPKAMGACEQAKRPLAGGAQAVNRAHGLATRAEADHRDGSRPRTPQRGDRYQTRRPPGRTLVVAPPTKKILHHRSRPHKHVPLAQRKGTRALFTLPCQGRLRGVPASIPSPLRGRGLP